MTGSELNAHPRLLADARQLRGLAEKPALPFLLRAAARVERDAEHYLNCPGCEPLRNAHNAHLRRAREMQGRVVTLLARWLQTGDGRYRDCAVQHLRRMAEWEYWSWIAWRGGEGPGSLFDLSYGVNSATLALGYDWLYGTLSDEESELLLRTGRERSMKPFLQHTEGENWPRWFRLEHSNWNAVCSGGAGLFALAAGGELEESEKVLSRVEDSIEVFMRGLQETGGGWTEGIGYWNFGMRYAFTYLLSHERASGSAHPMMELPETRATLGFPTDFCPHGVPCGFGDSNHWRPGPFHYAAAVRLGRDDVRAVLDRAMAESEEVPGGRGQAAQWLVLHPGDTPESNPREDGVLKLYEGMDWGIVADRMPRPGIYLSVRGGTTKVHHGHRDLLSYHCVVGDEPMITNIGEGPYLDTTFSSRRWELFEMMPASKNTILINGVGVAEGSEVRTEPVEGEGIRGFRLEATEAMGVSRGEEPAAEFCARVLLCVQDRGFLIIDRAVLPHVGLVESRAFTYTDVECDGNVASLRGDRHRMRVVYACSVPAALHTATAAPTTPRRPATMLRWCTEGQHLEAVMSTLLAPDVGAARVEMAGEPAGLTVEATAGQWTAAVRLTEELRLA